MNKKFSKSIFSKPHGFTFLHSSSVSIVAETIAKYINFSETECKILKVAGLIHDLGKLGIPTEIIEKPVRLTEDEITIIKKHPYLTYRAFEGIDALDTINLWASLHHEKLDGTGYPFHLKE